MGEKILKLLNGKEVTVQNILRNNTLTKIVVNYFRDYVTAAAFAAAEVEVPTPEQRCQHTDTANGNGDARCFCCAGHERADKGGCKFTVPGVPSISTARPPARALTPARACVRTHCRVHVPRVRV